MRLDGSFVFLDPRTISKVERDGTVTKVSTGIGSDVLVMESPEEVMLKIEAATVHPSEKASAGS